MQENSNIKGKKIKGFFGIFDILGYKDLIDHNSLDDVINIYYNFIQNRDLAALAFGNSNTTELKPSVEAKRLAFSDTFIFYQEFFGDEEPIKKLQRTSALLIYSCYLLRFAFDTGIPLRGAISFGEYHIDRENICFLGRPVVEAYDACQNQDWCGAILCDSALDIIKPLLQDKDLRSLVQQLRSSNNDCKNCDKLCPYDPSELITEYEIPHKNSALRLDN